MVKSFHSIGDTITFECLIDANPEPDIRWIHRFTDDINQEMDLSRQFHQGFAKNNHRRDGPIWSITQEKLNATRWKTNLFIQVSAILLRIGLFMNTCVVFQHLPKRFFNSNFICRAANRHGQNERSITVIPNHHHSRQHAPKKHRHTTTTTGTATVDLSKQNHLQRSQSSSTTRNEDRFHFISFE